MKSRASHAVRGRHRLAHLGRGLSPGLGLALALLALTPVAHSQAPAPAKRAAPPATPSAQRPAAQDVRAIQAREAQKTDERTLAYFEKFKTALMARAGADPLLSMLVFDEQEGQALVHAAAGAPAEHLIYQQGQWISTDGRQLKPWAPDADPARARFRLSTVTEKFIRDRMRAHRAQAGQAADHLGPLRVGYFGKPFERLIVEMQTVSMASFGMASAQFDLATGAPLDVIGAVKQARSEREADAKKDAAAIAEARKRNLLKEASDILAQFRREFGTARLMAVYIKRHEVTFVQADKTVVEYDPRGRFTRSPKPYDKIWLCSEGFDDREIDWSGFPNLVQKALLAGALDEEDREHAEIDVERPRECKPTNIEIRFTNYTLPNPSVSFDAAGRVKR